MSGCGPAKSGSRSLREYRPRVLALLPKEEPNAVDYYRIVQAFDLLQDKGYPVKYVPYTVARRLAQSGWDPGDFDVFVICRAAITDTDQRLLEFIEVLQSAGKKLIYETDDDYTNVARRATEGDATTPMSLCDAATVSTPFLAKRLRQFNPNIHVLANYINPDIWDKVTRREDDGKVVIGLAGTGTHFEDWKLVQDALFCLSARDDVVFQFVGYKPYYLENLPNSTLINPLPYPQYAQALAQVDIGLCPLVPDDLFNLSKSPVKALEYMAAGVAVVAQDMPVYRQVVANKSNGLLASDDWYEKILLILEDKTMRQRLAGKGWRWVRKYKNIHTHALQWMQVYEEVYQT